MEQRTPKRQGMKREGTKKRERRLADWPIGGARFVTCGLCANQQLALVFLETRDCTGSNSFKWQENEPQRTSFETKPRRP